MRKSISDRPGAPALLVSNMETILRSPGLCIPGYQRAYTWKSMHVILLLNDIRNAMKAQPVYRLGTVIFHKDEEEQLNIVDGQQRLVTIIVILYTLGEQMSGLLDVTFAHDESVANIRSAQAATAQWIAGLPAENQLQFKDYLLRHCQALTITLHNLSEAFQFFDAQNSRGRPLDPTDLLKAYHLREMASCGPEEKRRCADIWDDIGEAKLNSLIGTYLYRIRLWSRGKHAGRFTKEDIDEFKGFNLTDAPGYPFLAPYKLQQTAATNAPYPFQINQVILNGAHFFDMVHRNTKTQEFT